MNTPVYPYQNRGSTTLTRTTKIKNNYDLKTYKLRHLKYYFSFCSTKELVGSQIIMILNLKSMDIHQGGDSLRSVF